MIFCAKMLLMILSHFVKLSVSLPGQLSCQLKVFILRYTNLKMFALFDNDYPIF